MRTLHRHAAAPGFSGALILATWLVACNSPRQSASPPLSGSAPAPAGPSTETAPEGGPTMSRGSISPLEGYTKTRTGTMDSDRGTLTRTGSALVIHYDIGHSAGLHMSPERKPECSWYREQVVGPHQVTAGIVQADGGRTLVVSLRGKDRNPWTYPANFWAEVHSDAHVAEVLLTALAYAPEQTGQPR